MNYKILSILLLSTFLIGCEQVAMKPDKIETKIEKKYNSFAYTTVLKHEKVPNNDVSASLSLLLINITPNNIIVNPAKL